MGKDNAVTPPDERATANDRQAAQERKAKSVSRPGGFKNDPDDPTNPNEVRERHLRKLHR
jgi:hypothetical protein